MKESGGKKGDFSLEFSANLSGNFRKSGTLVCKQGCQISRRENTEMRMNRNASWVGKRLDVCGKLGNLMGIAARKAWVAKMGNGEQFNGQSGGNFEEHGKERGFRAGIIN